MHDISCRPEGSGPLPLLYDEWKKWKSRAETASWENIDTPGKGAAKGEKGIDIGERGVVK